MLLNLIITLLTPMFLRAAEGNLIFARHAAIETLNAYRAETEADLITVAKIIGFGLAALAALGRSMAEDLPVAMILRLNASATAADRAEHRNRRVLKEIKPRRMPEPEIDQAALAATSAEMKQRTAEHLARFTAPAAKRAPTAGPARTTQPIPTAEPDATAKPTSTAQPAETDEQHYLATWAASAAAIAAETTADLPNMPPEERAYAAIWINVLNDCANDFMGGNMPPRLRPGDLAGMMSSNP